MAHAPRLKYKIDHQISLLPRAVTVMQVIKDLSIPKRTFFSDKGILLSDRREIPGDRLAKYAAYFGISMEELYTVPVRMKSIHERTHKIKTPLK